MSDARAVIRNCIGVGIAVGAYGFAFGAAAVASGLSVLQSCLLSLFAFTGAETVRWFSGNPDRIGVTTEGWQHLTRYRSDERILDAHGLVPGRYVLAVSSPTPNKNFGRLNARQAPRNVQLGFRLTF